MGGMGSGMMGAIGGMGGAWPVLLTGKLFAALGGGQTCRMPVLLVN